MSGAHDLYAARAGIRVSNSEDLRYPGSRLTKLANDPRDLPVGRHELLHLFPHLLCTETGRGLPPTNHEGSVFFFTVRKSRVNLVIAIPPIEQTPPMACKPRGGRLPVWNPLVQVDRKVRRLSRTD